MKDWQSQAHVKWECKYHVVILPQLPVPMLSLSQMISPAHSSPQAVRTLWSVPSRTIVHSQRCAPSLCESFGTGRSRRSSSGRVP